LRIAGSMAMTFMSRCGEDGGELAVHQCIPISLDYLRLRRGAGGRFLRTGRAGESSRSAV